MAINRAMVSRCIKHTNSTFKQVMFLRLEVVDHLDTLYLLLTHQYPIGIDGSPYLEVFGGGI